MADINRPSRVLKNFTATPPLGSISTSTCSSAGMVSSTESMDCWITGSPFSPPKNSDRKSTRLNSSHSQISYAVFCLKKNKKVRDVPKKESNTRATIYSFRHGQTEDNANFMFSGWRDSLLTENFFLKGGAPPKIFLFPPPDLLTS